jgi:hypothetical protein
MITSFTDYGLIQRERDNPRDWNTKLAKFLFKLNLASLHSPNLILRDLLVNYFELLCSHFLSCSAHLSWVCCHSLLIFECVVTHLFECVVTLVTDRLGSPFLCKGPSSTSVKLFFSVSAQPQLFDVESPRDVDTFKPNSVISYVLVWSFIFFSHISLIAIFLWELNQIELYSAAITLEH